MSNSHRTKRLMSLKRQIKQHKHQNPRLVLCQSHRAPPAVRYVLDEYYSLNPKSKRQQRCYHAWNHGKKKSIRQKLKEALRAEPHE